MGRLFCWVICTASKAYLVLNTKLFLSHTSFSSLLVCIICKISCHPAFAIHLVFDLGHSSSPTSLLACEYHKLFVPTCHTSLMEQTFPSLRLPYQYLTSKYSSPRLALYQLSACVMVDSSLSLVSTHLSPVVFFPITLSFPEDWFYGFLTRSVWCVWSVSVCSRLSQLAGFGTL